MDSQGGVRCWRRNCAMNDTPTPFRHSKRGIVGMAARADSETGVGEAFLLHSDPLYLTSPCIYTWLILSIYISFFSLNL